MVTRPHVVIVGGGFAGLETVFQLRHRLQDKVNLTLVSDRGYFVFRPNTIYIPFGEEPEKYRMYLNRPMLNKQIDLVEGRARNIDTVKQLVDLHDFQMSYDYLVLATGAGVRNADIPGLAEHAISLWTPEEMERLGVAYRKLVENAKAGRQNLLFLVPPHVRYAGPVYEMAFMTDTWLREQRVRGEVEITLATSEDSYFQAFGPKMDLLVTSELEERGIRGLKRLAVRGMEPGKALFENGESVVYDLAVCLPPSAAAQTFDRLAVGDRGFLAVDAASRRVRGYDNVFAVGDCSDFPIKQAYLALLQADAAADHISGAILHEAPEVFFEPMGVCILEQLDKAAFAQVPLRYTSDPSRPVAVDTGDLEHYKVGVSPLWRNGKKMMGTYLPWRFEHGEPFHQGFAWETMNTGLQVASRFLSR